MDIQANSPASANVTQFEDAPKVSVEVSQQRAAPCPYQVKALTDLADLARQVI